MIAAVEEVVAGVAGAEPETMISHITICAVIIDLSQALDILFKNSSCH